MSETATAPSKELVRIAPELDRLARLGSWLAAAESPQPSETERAAAAALRLAYAESLDLPLLAATELSIIKGRLVVSAQLLRALAERQGYRVERVEATDRSCTARLWHEGEPIGETTFTIEEARTAGLIKERSNWVSYPARMLWARASAFVVKDFAPSVALGVVTEEEAVEMAYKREWETAVRAPIVLGPEIGSEPEPDPGPDSEAATVSQLEPRRDSASDPGPEPGPEWRSEPLEPENAPPPPPGDSPFTPPVLREDDSRPLTEPQRRKIYALLSKLRKARPEIYDDGRVKMHMGTRFGTESVSELTRYQAHEFIDELVLAESVIER